jgi:hypothetical protein
MKLRYLALAVTPLVASAAPAPAQSTSAFDGQWSVTQECPASGTARGYTVRYPMTVAKGVARAQHGSEGKPGSWTVSGPIAADGSATFSVRGLTGAADLTPRNLVEGSPFSYSFPAHFEARRGTAKRTMQRACTFTFERN